WNTDVDLELPMAPEQFMPLHGSDIYARMTEKEKKALNIETFSWTLSQFLHGEQGALLATAQLVDSVQNIDSKLYAASQGGDEARHVAFGILSLRDFYREQPESVRREREDFVYEAAVLMRDRFLFQEVWEKQGLPAKECMEIALHNHGQVMFRQMLFAKIVPAIKKMDLLSDRQRKRFEELGILQFENWADPVADA